MGRPLRVCGLFQRRRQKNDSHSGENVVCLDRMGIEWIWGDEMTQKIFRCAIAQIRGSRPGLWGVVRFFQRGDGVLVEAEVTGLPKTETGFFAFHIHEGKSCDGEGFPDSGGHFNPGGAAHPSHAGDLPPLLADHGKAYMRVLTDCFHVDEIIGKTVIIHSEPDDFHTQPSGNAGAKIGCGVIRRACANRS